MRIDTDHQGILGSAYCDKSPRVLELSTLFPCDVGLWYVILLVGWSNSVDLGEVNRVLNVDVLCIGRLLFL